MRLIKILVMAISMALFLGPYESSSAESASNINARNDFYEVNFELTNLTGSGLVSNQDYGIVPSLKILRKPIFKTQSTQYPSCKLSPAYQFAVNKYKTSATWQFSLWYSIEARGRAININDPQSAPLADEANVYGYMDKDGALLAANEYGEIPWDAKSNYVTNDGKLTRSALLVKFSNPGDYVIRFKVTGRQLAQAWNLGSPGCETYGDHQDQPEYSGTIFLGNVLDASVLECQKNLDSAKRINEKIPTLIKRYPKDKSVIQFFAESEGLKSSCPTENIISDLEKSFTNLLLRLSENSILVKKTTIKCSKNNSIKYVTAISPKCPAGYKKK